MDDHFDGRPLGLVAPGCETGGSGGAVRRGLRGGSGRCDTRAEPAGHRRMTAMPETPRPGPRRAALARTFCLEPVLASVAVARRAVAALVREWGTAIDVDTATLLTSELVANAVIHGGAPGKPVLLVVFDLAGGLRVEVHDPGGPGVECKRPTMDGESGRGLAIVAALADFWDWEPTGWGKVVYFGLSATSEARAA